MQISTFCKCNEQQDVCFELGVIINKIKMAFSSY